MILRGAYWDLPVAFYFSVKFLGIDGGLIGQIPFKEVSGLNTEMELETIQEGGLNTYEHKLPKQKKHGNLVLKRALVPDETLLSTWLREILEGDFSNPIRMATVEISLLNHSGVAIYSWVCDNAFPVKWDVEPLDSEKNQILIESIELTYTQITRLEKWL